MGAAQSAKDSRCFFSRTEDGMWDHNETNVGLCLLADGTFELVWRQWEQPDNFPMATIETVSMSGSVVTEGGGDEMKLSFDAARTVGSSRAESALVNVVLAPLLALKFFRLGPRPLATGIPDAKLVLQSDHEGKQLAKLTFHEVSALDNENNQLTVQGYTTSVTMQGRAPHDLEREIAECCGGRQRNSLEGWSD